MNALLLATMNEPYSSENYESDMDSVSSSDDHPSSLKGILYSYDKDNKRRENNTDEKKSKSRERNRIHARNSRERKKQQINILEDKLQGLLDERQRLLANPTDQSIAFTLMALTGNFDSKDTDPAAAASNAVPNQNSSRASAHKNSLTSVKEYLFESKINLAIPIDIDEEEEEDEDTELRALMREKNRTLCTPQELNDLRRERNRIHAKKTRMRKKKFIQLMETCIPMLEREVNSLRQSHQLTVDISVQQENEKKGDTSHESIGKPRYYDSISMAKSNKRFKTEGLVN